MTTFVKVRNLTFDTVVNYQGKYVDLAVQLSGLLAQLSKNVRPVTAADLLAVSINRATETVELLFLNEVLIGTAQASLVRTLGAPLVVVNNVVIHNDYRRQGFGTQLMQQVLRRVRLKWQHDEPLLVQLTSRADRGTAHMYAELGFTVRNTIVYQQMIQ